MQSRLYRQTCSLACLAIFTATALVGCGQATGKTATPEAVRIAPVTLQVGAAPYQISLSNKFSGEKLTYTAASDKPAVATAKVDDATLTVTAVGAGTATITVTATDPEERSAKTSFTVTVSQPEEEAAPTVRSGATDSVDVDQGDTETVTLSRVFTGADLEFTVSSSYPDAATASESAGILTFTARSPGSATITIVATNDAGTATHRIAVTVPQPTTTPPTTTPTTPQEDCSLSGSSLTVTVRIIRDNSKKCTLPAKHSLVYSGDELRVRGPDSSATTEVWTITAIDKGRHVVQVRKDESGDTVGEITVIVPNTPPQLDDDDATSTVSGTIAPKTDTLLHTLTIPSSGNLADSFTDVDSTDNAADTGIFNYKVQHKPDELLIKTVHGFLLEANSSSSVPAIDAVVLKPLTKDFSIEVYAYDRDNARSDNPVKVNFTASVDSSVDPAMGTYVLVKGTGTSYKTTKVGNRIGVVHTINLINSVAGDGIVNYDFRDFVDIPTIKDFIKARDSSYDVVNSVVTVATTTECTLANGRPTNEPLQATGAQGLGCWFASISGTEASPGAAFSGGTTIEFQLGKDRRLNDASDVTIIIDYYVVTKAGVAADTSADPPVRAQAAQIPKMGSRRLTLDIHPCTTTDDCP